MDPRKFNLEQHIAEIGDFQIKQEKEMEVQIDWEISDWNRRYWNQIEEE